MYHTLRLLFIKRYLLKESSCCLNQTQALSMTKNVTFVIPVGQHNLSEEERHELMALINETIAGTFDPGQTVRFWHKYTHNQKISFKNVIDTIRHLNLELLPLDMPEEINSLAFSLNKIRRKDYAQFNTLEKLLVFYSAVKVFLQKISVLRFNDKTILTKGDRQNKFQYPFLN